MDHLLLDSSFDVAFDEKVSSGLQSVAVEIAPESALKKDGITHPKSDKDNYASGQDAWSRLQSWFVTKTLSCLSWLKVLLAMQD
jgi:hypothetical protein